MTDKNGKEIKTGDTVKITGGYFKNDNGYFCVTHSPGDSNWTGSKHCLKRLNKNGTRSTGKYSIQFWPLSVVVNSFKLGSDARKHNEKNAQIEVIADLREGG